MWRQHVNAILSRPHETLDIVVASLISGESLFRVVNGDCFIVCFVNGVMHGKQGSKVWWSVPYRDTPFMSSRRTVCSSWGPIPLQLSRICGRPSIAGDIG